MHCPACQTTKLKRSRLEEYLSAHTCDDCSGHWISSYDYWHWLEWHIQDTEAYVPDMPEQQSLELEANDNRKASFCPDCNHLMRKAPVGKGLQFYLDRCSHCGGVWFDKNEWETLADCNLHDKVHLIFSESWQADIRHKKFKDVLEETYRAALGDDLYAKTMSIKDWIDQHPKKDYILSLLNQQLFNDPQVISENKTEMVQYVSHMNDDVNVHHDAISVHKADVNITPEKNSASANR